MYVAGSHTARDWYDDVTKIPFWGDLKNSERYQAADKMLTANPQIRTIVGHSLGGAVSHELQRAHPGLKTVTYGAPSISWGTAGGENRYRNAYDPVSMFDRGATRLRQPHPLMYKSLTHDYHNSEKTSAEPGVEGVEGKTENPDSSVTITE
jgi:pimeloyl-ACP methyl ester carboxylesterase